MTALDPHPPAPDRPRLSVVLPAYGEERRIGSSVTRLRAALAGPVGPGGLEIVVVDDGSADATARLAAEAGADRVIRFPRNRGKGAAVREGVLAAAGSTVVFTDADLAYPPAQVLRMLEEVERGWDVVVGNRHHRAAQVSARDPVVRRLSHTFFHVATRAVVGRRFGDTQCGLKGFHRPAAQVLFERTAIDGFAFDVEVLWLAGRLGLAVTEVPVELEDAEGSTVRVSVDAVRMVRDLVRIRVRALSGRFPPPPGREPGAGPG